MNELETQLASWALRRPSAKLKRRIFALRPAVPPAAHSFSWLAPATAAVLVVGMLLNQRRCPTLFEAAKSGPMVAMIISNQSAAACLPAGFGSEQNSLPANAFHWTNGGQPAATPAVFTPTRH